MADYQNTLVYREEWTDKVQERLSEPNKWKDICNVEYTNTKVLHNPYLTDPSVSALVRGCSYTIAAVTETDDNVSIADGNIIAQFIDDADMAQSTFLKQMNMADRQAELLNEGIETAVYAAHASFTDFTNTAIGGGAGSITVSLTNIDNIITGVRREINEAKGSSLLERNGGFFVWRPADLEILEQFCMMNGFSFADNVLENGIKQGKVALGMTHYSSNLLPAGRVVAGVKKAIHLGIVRSTYGKITTVQDGGGAPGIVIRSRTDHKVKVWNKLVPVVFDVAVV